MERYRIYVGAIQNLTHKTKYSCCDPTMARLLVYSSKKPEGDFRMMKAKEEETFSAIERRWILNARLAEAFENTSQSAKEVARNMNELMDALEKELQKEKEALNHVETQDE
jgi:uncharacterized protein YukE